MMTDKPEKPLIDCYEHMGGLPVLGCIPGSPAVGAGIKVGDLILEVNGMPVSGPDSYLQARNLETQFMRVRLKRQGELLDVTIWFESPVAESPDLTLN